MPELHSVTFVWPLMLWLLLLLPLLVLVYAVLLRRRQRSASPWPQQASDAPGRSAWRRGWQRHGPALCLLLGLALLLLAVARPRAIVRLPARVDTVMLLIDSSGSMRAGDVKPSRIEAAQAAARSFIDAQPRHVKLGIVSMAAAAAMVQAPTDDRDALYRAVDALALQRGTALGSGIVIALASLLPAAGLDVQALIHGPARNTPAAAPLPGTAASAPALKAEPGSNAGLAMVLLSDGQSNTGPDAIKMAELAASLGVRVFTVGVGTPEGTVLKAQGMSMRVRLDEETLRKVASITRADYFRATSQQDLQKIYRALGSRIAMHKHQLTEVSGVLALLGMLWVMCAAALSFSRHGRIV